MLKKTIKYTDFEGNARSVECMFNLSRNELTKMELSAQGGLEKFLQNIINERDSEAMGKLIDQLILMSYGKISPDGDRFVKSPELMDSFKQTNAYDELYMELITDAEKLAAFIAGVIPQNMLPAGKTQEQLVQEAVTAMKAAE